MPMPDMPSERIEDIKFRHPEGEPCQLFDPTSREWDQPPWQGFNSDEEDIVI